jgi:hypothetical protein
MKNSSIKNQKKNKLKNLFFRLALAYGIFFQPQRVGADDNNFNDNNFNPRNEQVINDQDLPDKSYDKSYITLANSLKSKSKSGHFKNQLSINKRFQHFFKLIEPIIERTLENSLFWQILAEYNKPFLPSMPISRSSLGNPLDGLEGKSSFYISGDNNLKNDFDARLKVEVLKKEALQRIQDAKKQEILKLFEWEVLKSKSRADYGISKEELKRGMTVGTGLFVGKDIIPEKYADLDFLFESDSSKLTPREQKVVKSLRSKSTKSTKDKKDRSKSSFFAEAWVPEVKKSDCKTVFGIQDKGQTKLNMKQFDSEGEGLAPSGLLYNHK